MKCLSDGELRAKLDGELSDSTAAESHLAACKNCRERQRAISANAARTNEALAQLDSDFEGDAAAAYERFESARGESSPAGGRHGLRIFSSHPASAWGGIAAAILIAVMIAFAPARTVGQRVLAMLRVQRVAVVPVGLSAGPGKAAMQTITRLLSDQVVVTLSPGKAQPVPGAAQASQLAGFDVRTLGGEATPPAISVEGERAFVMTLNRDRLQQVLSALGRSDLQLPASINGSTIAVHIPKSVLVSYGDCPPAGRGASSPPAPSASATGGCTMLMEAPSPVVSVPPELNISQLAAIALEAAGMTAQDAEAFCQTVDWTSTLVVPVPTSIATSTQVSVDGSTGTLILGRQRDGRPAQYDLLWVKKGIVYSLRGYGNAATALGIAGSIG